MAFFRGEQGTVKFDKDAGGVALSEIAAVRSWSMTVDKDTLETTAHGDTFRGYVGTLIGANGTLEALYDAPGAGDKLDLLKEVFTPSDPGNAELELYLDEASGKKITCTALVTNAEYGASVGELQVVSVSFTANGTITLSI